MNLGFADVAALAAILDRALTAGGQVSDMAALRQYEADRLKQNIAMINGLDVLKRVFACGDDTALGLLRDTGLAAFNAIDPVKSATMRYAMGDFSAPEETM